MKRAISTTSYIPKDDFSPLLNLTQRKESIPPSNETPKSSTYLTSMRFIQAEDTAQGLDILTQEKNLKNNGHLSFQAIVKKYPQHIIPWIDNNIKSGLLSRQDAIYWIFPLLVKSGGIELENFYNFLVRIGDAKSVIEYSLHASEQNLSHRYIQLASSIIADFGERSFFVLESLFASDHPELEEFVFTACFLDGIDEEKRHYLLLLIKDNPVEDARLELVYALEYCKYPFRNEMLQQLANDRSETVREEARTILDR